MRFGRLARTSIAACVLILAAAACGGNDAGEEAQTGSGGLEKTDIKVGLLPIPDAAPVFVAIKRGFFKQEGLNVTTEIVAGGAAAVPKLAAGSLDIIQQNYVSAFSAQAAGLVKQRIIADAYQAKPDTFVIVVPGDSKIKTMADLAGKKIAVNTLNNIATLAVTTAARTQNVEIKDDQFVELPFPNHIQALKTGQVDASFMPEPFITESLRTLGARKIVDTMTGPMADFPIAGWVTTDDFLAKNPKTVAAFKRAMDKAQRLAATDRKAVEEVLPGYAHIDPQTAAVITLGAFPTSLSDVRLQRVADLMLEVGYLKQKVDAKSMIG